VREKMINEYIKLREVNGGRDLSRAEYLKKSEYYWGFKSVFATYRNLKRAAAGLDEPDVTKKKAMPKKATCKKLDLSKIKNEYAKGLIISDVHVPFHSTGLIQKLINVMKNNTIDFFIINGDFLDLYSLSRYTSNSLYDLKDITLGFEYEVGNGILDLFDAVLGDAQKFFIYGNHEERFLTFCRDGDNAKFSDTLPSPKKALKLKERGYQVLTSATQDYIELCDGLEVIHGDYTNKYFTVKHLEHITKNIIVGHLHTLQVFTNPSGRVAYSCGFLGDMESNGFNYAKRLSKNRWKQGFLKVVIDKQSNFWITPCVVQDGKFEFEGVVY